MCPNATSSLIRLPKSSNWLVDQKSFSLTVRQDFHILRGASVTFTVSPASHHLYSLQFATIESIQTLLLIGSDYPPLITPVEPVHLGLPNCPAAIKTCLGWTLQGPNQEIKHHLPRQQCLFSVRLVYWPVLTSREFMDYNYMCSLTAVRNSLPAQSEIKRAFHCSSTRLLELEWME